MANTLTFANQTITDAHIFGGISYTADLNSGEEFSIGNTASASVTFVTDIQLPLYTKDNTNGTFTWTKDSTARGRYYITEVKKGQGKYTVTAYDAMILLNENISALSLSFPITVSALATAIATYLGCTVSGTVNNGNISVDSLDANMTIRKLLGYVAEASGCSVKIDGSDHLCFMYYASSGITISASDYIENGLEVAEYTCAAIDNVTIFGADGQVVGIYGSGTNSLYIQGNPLLYEATNTEAQAIYSQVSGFTYAPIRCSMFEENGLEIGVAATFGTTASLVMHLESSEGGAIASSVGVDARAPLIKTAETIATEALNTAQNLNQYFWYMAAGSEAGAHITEVPYEDFLNDPAHGGANLLARSNGIAVRDGTTALATFGATGATIGVTSDTHMELDAQSLKMIDRDADSFFVVSDARDSNGRINDKFVGNGTATTFILRTIASSLYSVTINGTATTAYTTSTTPSSQTTITFNSAPANNAIISVIYTPHDGSTAKYLTFGNRANGSSIGTTSVGIGKNVEASGSYSEARGVGAKASGSYGATAIGYSAEASGDFGSFASGYGAKASGIASHAEGYPNLNDGLYTEASGGASHAEGTGSQAKGASSHAEGYSTIASSKYQHAQGQFNVEDSSNVYADIVGNGTDHTHRKNISALEWAGNLRLKGDVYVGCNDDSTGGTKLTSGGGSVTFFGTSSESASTVAKTVTVDNSFTLTTGVEVSVKFTNTNSVANPTLNVNNTGAIAIKRYGTTAPSTSSASSWMAGSVITLTYDGTYWQMHDWLNTVTGVKGNAESTYRTGSVNLTPANIGAVPTSTTVNGHALTSNISVTTTDLGIDDYVTSKGSSGDWTYRKWNSGRVEAWYTGLFSFGATTKATNSYYADGTLAIPNGIFTSTPNCIASSVASSAGAINSAVFSLLCLGASSTQLTTRAFRVSANSSSNWQLRGNVYAWTN